MALRNAQVSKILDRAGPQRDVAPVILNVLSSHKKRPSRSKLRSTSITSPWRRITHTSVSISPQSGQAAVPGSQEPASATCPTNSAAEGVCSPERFCPSTPVLALAPTTPNSTVYGVCVYQTCTFSVPFRRKPRPNRPVDGGPFSLARILKPGRRRPTKPQPKCRPESPPPEIPPVFAAKAKDGESRPSAHERKEGPFPPQETAFYAESAETFEARNGLAAKRPDPVM